MKRLLFIMLAMALFATTGCEVDGGDGTTGDADATTTDTVDNDTGTDPVPVPYQYVLIEDLSDTGGEDPGADIDAVVLIKDGVRSYAGRPVAYFFPADTEPLRSNEFEVVDEPDAHTEYPASTGICLVDGSFASLGGVGGYILVEMDEEIENGDTLEVIEIGGGCFFGDNGEDEARAEEVQVSVSTADDLDGTWAVIGTGTSTSSPIISFTVTALPDVFAD